MDKSGKASNTFFLNYQPKPFSLITKPAGSLCNLNCTYCFYLEKHHLYSGRKITKMSDDILEEYISQYIASQPVPEVNFIWQGGEPCLMGIDFYKKAIALQRKYAAGKQIENSFQTNGILLNDDWCRFFHDNRFLVGISIDGPKELHDKYRITKTGGPSFDKVVKAIALLRKHRVEFNTLTVVNNHNVDFPLEIYRFLKSVGSHYMQFTPIVERVCSEKLNTGLQLVSNEQRDDAVVTDWSVDALKYGKFLKAIFDEWVKKDVGQYFVQMFDATLANWVGAQPGVCIMAERCGNAGVIEHNGDVYSCDHFVFPGYHLGNITKEGLKEMMNSVTQQLFGDTKVSALPGQCRECRYLDKCWGECPKNRFLTTPQGEYGLNYLCEGLKYFFSQVTPAMEFMANEINNKRSPANIMHDNYH
jgi:uncharacterized protein